LPDPDTGARPGPSSPPPRDSSETLEYCPVRQEGFPSSTAMNAPSDRSEPAPPPPPPQPPASSASQPEGREQGPRQPASPGPHKALPQRPSPRPGKTRTRWTLPALAAAQPKCLRQSSTTMYVAAPPVPARRWSSCPPTVWAPRATPSAPPATPGLAPPPLRVPRRRERIGFIPHLERRRPRRAAQGPGAGDGEVAKPIQPR
jgi:hypothetical protein